jgi:putative restriction endonuclease
VCWATTTTLRQTSVSIPLLSTIFTDAHLPNTTRTALIKARFGQGLFKERVGRIERACRITFVDDPAHLIV